MSSLGDRFAHRILMPLVMVLAGACNKRGDDANPQREREPQAQPVERTPGSGVAEQERIEPAAVEALVERWLDAQNGGQFDAYAALYAERMTGIKRAGPRTHQFDRAGWLADRKRMFEKPMTVAVSDLEIRSGHGSAIAQFTQRWSSGRFSDVGPKQLVVIAHDGALEIAREEMLSSQLTGHAAEGTALRTELFAPIWDQYMILEPATHEDGRDPRTMIHDADRGDDDYVVRAPVKDTTRARARAWEGRTVTAVDSDGTTCTTKTGKLVVLAGLFPHFGVIQDWNDSFGERGRKSTPQERADDVYHLGDVYLAVELPESCALSWARTETVAGFRVLKTFADAQVNAAASSAFERLPAWKTLQRDYLADGGSTGSNWDDDHRTTAVFRDPTDNRAYAVVSAAAGDGCGRFRGELASIFVIAESGKAKPLSGEGLMRPFEPTTALDLDLDGDIEFFDGTSLIGRHEGEYTELLDVSWPNQDCPC